MSYCNIVKDKMSRTRLLDAVDVAIFGFLLQDADRLEYVTRNDRIILTDNDGFDNPNADYVDILAPLYQCCV